MKTESVIEVSFVGWLGILGALQLGVIGIVAVLLVVAALLNNSKDIATAITIPVAVWGLVSAPIDVTLLVFAISIIFGFVAADA